MAEIIVKYKEDTDRMKVKGGEYVQDLIRCKECKHAHMTYGGECKYCDMWKDDDDNYIELHLDGDYFCASGERKDQDERH